MSLLLTLASPSSGIVLPIPDLTGLLHLYSVNGISTGWRNGSGIVDTNLELNVDSTASYPFPLEWSTITGSDLTVWHDQTSNNKIASASGSSPTINIGAQTLNWNGTTQALATASSNIVSMNAVTVYCVLKTDTLATLQTFFQYKPAANFTSDANALFVLYITAAGVLTLAQKNSTGEVNSKLYTLGNTTANVITAVLDRSIAGAGATVLTINNSTTGVTNGSTNNMSGNFNDSQPIGFGTGNPTGSGTVRLDGVLYDLWVFQGAHDNTRQTEITTFLTNLRYINMLKVTVDQNTSRQTWKGSEATAQVSQLEYPVTFPNYDTEVIDAADDLGIDRIRVEALSGLVESGTDYYQLFLDDNLDVVDNTNPTSWANVRANRRIPVNDNADPNVINASGFQWAWLDRQIDTVVIPLQARAAAKGETLEWFICYVHFSASNQLHVDTPAEYGELMLAIWNHCNSTYSMIPSGLEIFLEPDNTPAVISSEIASMINAAYDRITGASYAAPYIIAPSTTTSPACLAFYQGIKSANATAGSRISEVSRHRYGTQPDDAQLGALRDELEADGKYGSMLEAGAGIASGGNGVEGLYKDVIVGRVSAWQQFTLAYRSLGGVITDDGNQYFLVGDSPGYAVTVGNRTKYLRHFFKYVRRNAVMRDVTNQDANYQGIAFRNANGKYAAVVLCRAGGSYPQNLAIVGLPAGTYGIRYTLGDLQAAPSAYDQSLSNQTIVAGQDVVFTMTVAGIVTIFGV